MPVMEPMAGEHVEPVPPVHLPGQLPLAAHFVEADGEKRPDQCESGRRGKEQGDELAIEIRRDEIGGHHRVNQPEHDQVGARGGEVLPSPAQCEEDIGEADAPHHRQAGFGAAEICLRRSAAEHFCGLELRQDPFHGIADVHCLLLRKRFCLRLLLAHSH